LGRGLGLLGLQGFFILNSLGLVNDGGNGRRLLAQHGHATAIDGNGCGCGQRASGWVDAHLLCWCGKVDLCCAWRLLADALLDAVFP
jgi:hypothetical protein